MKYLYALTLSAPLIPSILLLSVSSIRYICNNFHIIRFAQSLKLILILLRRILVEVGDICIWSG